jgi:ornithine decarboxylase
MVLEKIGHLCEYIHFDEAWAGFGAFHPLMKDHFAMGLKLTPDDPGVIATQSTHKQLAGFSQASQIHVRDAHIRDKPFRLNHKRFNEMFMLQASTSPFYPLFSSLDVNAQMHGDRAARVMWMTRLPASRRGRPCEAARRFSIRSCPTTVVHEGKQVKREDADRGAGPRSAVLAACRTQTWHGYRHPGKTPPMVDPTKPMRRRADRPPDRHTRRPDHHSSRRSCARTTSSRRRTT